MHGNRMDLLSLIDGSAQDFKLVIDYLPTYLSQFTRLHNIMTGISLGGHVAWRMAALTRPGQIAAYAMVVGSPNLTSLLLDRLGIDVDSLGPNANPDRLDLVGYEHLYDAMNTQQRRYWPRALAELVRESDRKVYEEFPVDTPMLLCNGALDPLVPAHFTTNWAASRTKQATTATISSFSYHQKHLTRGHGGGTERKQRLVETFVQDNTAHSCTKEMVSLIAMWLADMFQSR